MTDPPLPIAPPLQPCCRGLDERRARPPPKSVAAEGGRALPGSVQSGTRWSRVPSPTSPRCAHNTHTCGLTKQVKNRATALNQELNACQTSCLTQGAGRWAECLSPSRPHRGRAGPAGAVQFVKSAQGVNDTAPVGPSGADTAPQRTTGLNGITSRNQLICNVRHVSQTTKELRHDQKHPNHHPFPCSRGRPSGGRS